MKCPTSRDQSTKFNFICFNYKSGLSCKIVEQSKCNEENTENSIVSVLVRDLPTRLVHWLLVIFVIISITSAKI